jgi:hypothetical protein
VETSLSCRNRTQRLALIVAATLACSAMPAGAADWEANPKLALGYLYDNNYRLTPPDAEIEVSGAVLDAQLDLRAAGPLSEFSLVPRVRLTEFPDDPEEESDDYYATLGWEHRTQVMRAQVRADYSHETVATSEQPSTDIDSGLGDTGGADAGIAAIRNRRDLVRIRPSFSYDFSPRHRLEVGATATDVSFEDKLPAFQTDYRDYGIDVGYGFVTSPRSTVTVRALAARYDVEIEGNSADAYGLELEWSTSATETMEAFLRAGAQHTIFEDNELTGEAGEEVTTWLAGAGLRRSLKLTELFFDVTHSVGPTASGFVVQRDQVRFRWTHLFTPRFSMFSGVRGTRDDAVASDTLFNARNYATADIGMEWRILQQLSLVATVDYTWQDFETEASRDSESGGARLSFVYEPRRRD